MKEGGERVEDLAGYPTDSTTLNTQLHIKGVPSLWLQSFRCPALRAEAPRSAVIGFSHDEADFVIVLIRLMLDFMLQLTSTSQIS